MSSERILWDNANIAESYAGVTTPLTISFARHVYAQAYRHVALASGLSQRQITKERTIFDELVDGKHGQLYYNLNAWYRFTALFPGFKRNARNLERMLSVQRLADLPSHGSPSPWFRIRYPFVLLRRYVTFRRDLRRFVARVTRETDDFFTRKEITGDAGTLWAAYERNSQDLLAQWYIAIDNDFLVMTFVGMLSGVLKRTGTDVPLMLPELLAPRKSQLPGQIRTAKELLSAIIREPRLRTLLEMQQDVELWKTLEHMDEKIGAGRIFSQYVRTYGGRFPQELKLESHFPEEKPQEFFAMLRKLSQNGSSKGREHSFADSLRHVPFYARPFVRYSIRKVREHLEYREETRLLRAQVFHMVRMLMLAIGKRFAGTAMLQQPRDIFFLTLDEIGDHCTGKTAGSPSLQMIIAERKKSFAEYQLQDMPSRFWEINGTMMQASLEKEPPSSRLSGTGTAHGIAEGRAIVLLEPTLSEIQPGDILVTRHTDPGWTLAFQWISGIVVEYGGVLSHASIVAREYGIPCITHIPGITTSIQTGDRIRIDGTRGTVEHIL